MAASAVCVWMCTWMGDTVMHCVICRPGKRHVNASSLTICAAWSDVSQFLSTIGLYNQMQRRECPLIKYSYAQSSCLVSQMTADSLYVEQPFTIFAFRHGQPTHCTTEFYSNTLTPWRRCQMFAWLPLCLSDASYQFCAGAFMSCWLKRLVRQLPYKKQNKYFKLPKNCWYFYMKKILDSLIKTI